MDRGPEMHRLGYGHLERPGAPASSGAPLGAPALAEEGKLQQRVQSEANQQHPKRRIQYLAEDGSSLMLAAELEYCLLSLLVGGADPLPLILLSACTGAILDPVVLTDDTYDELYFRSQGKGPSARLTGPIYASRNRLPALNMYPQPCDVDIIQGPVDSRRFLAGSSHVLIRNSAPTTEDIAALANPPTRAYTRDVRGTDMTYDEYDELECGTFYPDYIFYRILINGRPDRSMLKAIAASLSPQAASQLLDIKELFSEGIFTGLTYPGAYHDICISGESQEIFLAALLGCAARSKDKGWPYFDLLANSGRAAKFFGPKVVRSYEHAPVALRDWVREGLSHAGGYDRHICDYAISQLGLYSATLSTIGCSTHVVDRVVRNRGFGGKEPNSTPDLIGELVDCLKWTSVKNNRSIIEYNFRALFSLQYKTILAMDFNEWVGTYFYTQRGGKYPPAQDYYTYVFRAAMERAAPFELKIVRPGSSRTSNYDYDKYMTVFGYIVRAGPVKGVRVDSYTKPLFTRYALTTMANQYKGGDALSAELLDSIWRFTGLAGHIDSDAYEETVDEVWRTLRGLPGVSLKLLSELPRFRKLMTGRPVG